MSEICVPLDQRAYLSRYAVEQIGVVLYANGVEADADANVLVAMFPDPISDDFISPPAIFTGRLATLVDVGTGMYQISLTSADTAVPGPYRLIWSFLRGGDPETVTTFVEVGQSSPAYDALDIDAKAVVELTNIRFADLFDSPLGGPNLQTYYQSNFGRNRLAQLLRIAVGRLNTIAQPTMTYTLDGQKAFPYLQWGALLEQSLYVEVLKHLRRSYLEQPQDVNVNLAKLDRSSYSADWAALYRDEQADLKAMQDNFKIAHMGFGSPRVLVSGGVYGNYGPTRFAGSAAARPRYYWRFY